MVFISVTPNHVRLINACYPAAPLAAGPQYRPNSQELSRLTYYASNRPGKLHKLSDELEKRAKNHARRAQAGNAKSKALLLVTLEILRALTAECRRDLTVFSSGVINSLDVSLTCLRGDIEVVERTASTFSAWATYTDGTLLGVDTSLTQTYLNILHTFSTMGDKEHQKVDDESRNRKRLLGLAVLSSAIQSDALFNSMSIFPKEVAIIVTALLRIIMAADLATLTTETTALETYTGPNSTSPYIPEFQTQRPIAQRRAPSIHVHIDGEKGPSFSDVVGSALRALQSLVAQSNTVQVPIVLEAVFNTFDQAENGSWQNLELCRWLVSKITEWTQYQYRYAVPSRLLDRLTNAKDAAKPSQLHFALIAMITTVFNSPTPLINLSTSDILSNLLSIIIARLVVDPNDPLLPNLVECVSSLGTHIYYSDQLQDLSEELVSRLVSIQVNGLVGRGRVGNDKGREAGMRCLVACLIGLLRVAEETHPPPAKVSPIRRGSGDHRRAGSSKFSVDQMEPGVLAREASNGDARMNSPEPQRARRNKVAPEVWLDSLALLCESDYAVRSDYASALVGFIKQEVKREPVALASMPELEKLDAAARVRRLAADHHEFIQPSDPTLRFLNALHATVFTLALAPNLGLINSAPSPSPSSSSVLVSPSPINIIPPTPAGTPRGEIVPNKSNGLTLSISSDNLSKSPESANPHRRSTASANRPRQTSLGLSLVDYPQSPTPSLIGSSATLSDYSHLLNILLAVHESLPVRSLLAGVPMLIALDSAVGGAAGKESEEGLHRRQVIREIVVKLWLSIANIWDCSHLREAVLKISTGLTTTIPLSRAESEQLLLGSERNPIGFSSVAHVPCDPALITSPHLVDPSVIIAALSENANLQKASGLDQTVLQSKLSVVWSADKAVKDSLDSGPAYDQISRSDNATHFLKISPALMSIDNQSLASLARTARGVGVEDLREALEGRGSMSNPNLGSHGGPLYSDPDRRSHRNQRDVDLSKIALTAAHKQRRMAKGEPGGVADVLDRLGIGMQQSSKVHRAPTQPPAKFQSTSKILLPPYGS